MKPVQQYAKRTAGSVRRFGQLGEAVVEEPLAWREHDRGGHSPAAAEPDLIAQSLRDALCPLRGAL